MKTSTLPSTIVVYPDPRLRKKCSPIEKFDEELAAIAAAMLELMRKNRGVGLAAPQVGFSRRMFVCNPTGEPEDDHIYVNPRLSELTGAVEAEEGCLSIPDVHVIVRRARRCHIDAQDLTGHPVSFDAEDLLARIWQHETDHLDGTLIVDRMNAADRIANKKQIDQLEADFRKTSKATARKKPR